MIAIKRRWHLISHKITSCFQERVTKLIGLNIGTAFVKIVQLDKLSKKNELTHFAIFSTGEHGLGQAASDDMAQLTEAVRHCLSLSCVTAKTVVLALSDHYVFSREIVLPAMSPQELAEAIHWTLDEYVPYETGSFYYDFAILDSDINSDRMRVLLVALLQSLLDPLLAVLEELHLRVLAVETESLALLRTITEKNNLMFLDIGARETQLTFIQAEAPVFTKSIGFGGAQLMELLADFLHCSVQEAQTFKEYQEPLLFAGETSGASRKGVAELSQQVRSAIDYYKRHYAEATFEKILLTGGGACWEGLSEIMAQDLDIPVFYHNPLARISISSLLDQDFLVKGAPTLGAAIGLAMRGDDT